MKKLFGGILIAVGILIAGGCGLCSLAILFGSGEMTGLEMWPAVLMVGGIPMAIGVLIAFGGRALLRRAREEESQA